jgi:hypothetical protein
MKKIRCKIHYFGGWGRLVGGKIERLPGDGWVAVFRILDGRIEHFRKALGPETIKKGNPTSKHPWDNSRFHTPGQFVGGDITRVDLQGRGPGGIQ